MVSHQDDPESFDAARELFDQVCNLPPDECNLRLSAVDPDLAQFVRELLAEDAVSMQGLDSPPIAASSLSARAGMPLPERIANFSIVESIGAGGMSTVYKARQDSPDRMVALKILRMATGSEDALRRFEHEAQILGWLEHPNIARIFEAGTADTGHGVQPYLAMELIEGQAITRFAKQRDLDLAARLELLAKICDAVHYAHQKGVIHRDLKPGNVLADARGEPKVLDFGMARATSAEEMLSSMHTMEGALIGTLPYMSPEQFGKDPSAVDTRADVYALGVIGYELLAGVLPHDVIGRSVPDAARVVVEDEPTSLGLRDRSLRGDVETIVGKAMAKESEHRYASADEFASDIRRFLRDEPIIARRPTVWYQARKFARRNRAFVGGLAAVFVALVAGIVVSTALYFEKEEERRVADDARELQEEVMQRFVEILHAPNPWRDGMDVLMVDVLDGAVERSKDAFLDRPAMRAQLLAAFGNTYCAIGLNDRGLPLLEEAARLREAGDDRLSAVLARASHAYSLARSGDASAIATMEEMHAILEEMAAPGAERARLGARLAEILQVRGRIADAEVYAKSAIALCEGKDEPAYAGPAFMSWKALGDLQIRSGRFAEGRVSLQRARELAAATVSGEAFEILTMNSMAIAHANLGETSEAIALMEEIRPRMRALGAERHAYYATQTSNLAAMEGRAGNHERALELFEEALDLNREIRPGPDRSEAIALSNVADVLREIGRSEEALEKARQSVDMLAQTVGRESVRYAGGLTSLGLVLIELEDWEEAAAAYAEAVEVKRKDAPDHPSLGKNIASLAEARLALGDWEGAAQAAREALETLGRTAPDSADALVDAGSSEALALALGDQVDRAASLVKEVEQQARDSLAEDDPQRLRAEAAAGLIQVLAGEQEAGWARYEAGARGLAAVETPGNRIGDRLRSLAEIVRSRKG